MAGWRAIAVVVGLGLPACNSVVQYTDELVDARHGRTLFTRLPATIGATAGFAAGVPVDVVAAPLAWVYYQSQPPATRDALSVFLFPSFVLWKAGALVGAPFDAVEWAAWRSWQPAVPITQEERERIEREWDAQEYTDYPVTPVYPLPRPLAGDATVATGVGHGVLARSSRPGGGATLSP